MKITILASILAISALAHAGGSDVGSADDHAYASNMFLPLATCKISKESEQAIVKSKSNRSGQFTIITDLGQLFSKQPAQAIVVMSDAQVGMLSDNSEHQVKTGVGAASTGLLKNYSEISDKAVFVSNPVIYNDVIQTTEQISFVVKAGQILSATWTTINKDGSINDTAFFNCKL